MFREGPGEEDWREANSRRSNTYHVNQDLERVTLPLLDELGGVMLLPLLQLVLAEVALERLLAPGAVDRVGDGCKGRDGLVFAGVAEELFFFFFNIS